MSGADDEEHIRAVAELCMVTDDLSPLLKLILESDPDGAIARKAKGISFDQPTDSSAGSIMGSMAKANDKWGMVEIVGKIVRALAADQDRAIRQVCEANAVEISQCVAELHSLHACVGRLRDLVSKGNGALATGTSLLSCAESLGELSVARSHISGGLSITSAARSLLGECREAGELLSQGKTYHALLQLSKVKKGTLETLALLAASHASGSVNQEQLSFSSSLQSPSPSSTTEVLVQSKGPQMVEVEGGGEAASQVRSFFLGDRGLIRDLTAAAKQLAMNEFNHWLLSIRTLAQKVGLRAVRRAAADRKLQESQSREREEILALMQRGVGLRDISRQLVSRDSRGQGSSFRQALRQEAESGPLPGVEEISRKIESSGSSSSPPAIEGKPLAALKGILAWERAMCMDLCPQPLKPSSTPPPPPSYHPSGGQQVQPSALDQTRSSDNASRRLQRSLYSTKDSSAPPSSSKTPGPSPDSHLPPSTHTASSLDHPGLPASLTDNDTVMPLMESVSMSAMLRCVQVHKQLGILKKLSLYYKEQRRLQVANDLLPPVNFLEHYQGYFARVSGFFVIERHVQLLEPQLVSQDHVNALWESACSTLKSSLDVALEGVRTTYILLLVKDFVLLMCGAMEAMGYSVVILEEVLAGHRQRYHDLLLTNAMESSLKLLEGDKLDQFSVMSQDPGISTKQTVQSKALKSSDPSDGNKAVREPPAPAEPVSEEKGAEGVKASKPSPVRTRKAMEVLGLPLTLPCIGPALPSSLLAPFTPCVPGLVEEVRKYVLDSLSYLEGLVPDWELPSAVFNQRNRMISKVLVESMQSKVTSCLKKNDVLAAMHMASNAWSILQSLDALDAWTMEKARPRSLQPSNSSSQEADDTTANGRAKRAKAKSRARQAVFAQDMAASNSVRASMRSVQDNAERCVAVLLTRRGTKVFESSAKSLPWLPNEPHKDVRSKYVEDLISILDETYSLGRSILPRPSFLSLCRVVTRSVGNGLVSLLSPLLSSASPKDVLAVASDASAAASVGPVRPAPVPSYNLLAVKRLLGEVRVLKAAAAEKCRVPELAIEEELCEAEQLCEVLLSENIEEVLDESVRRRKYPDLGLLTIALALERYRELTWIGKEKTNYPTRSEVTDLAKILRIQLERMMESGKW